MAGGAAMDLFDTHCHLDVEEFADDRQQVLQRARAAGVSRLIIPGIHAAGWPQLVELCRDEAGLYSALGLHPIYLEQHRTEDADALAEWVEKYQPLAIGEIGLDYYIQDLDRERQQQLFEAQLVIAREANLPVLLHVRKAHDQVLATLRRLRIRGGIAHAFSGSLQQAEQYMELGFKLGFGGMLTYERSSKLRRLAKTLPISAIVLETDAPDMTPAAHHGERNSPEYLPEVLSSLAEIRDESPECLAQQTTANAKELFGLI
jgi:TatD DNase family protein